MRLAPVCLLIACAHASPPQHDSIPPAQYPARSAPVTPHVEAQPADEPAGQPAVAEPLPRPTSNHSPDVDALIAGMSVEAKVGQLMMVGFGGHAVDASIVALVKGKLVGGVCMFKRNINDPLQVGQLNDGVRALLADSIPPFIAVDQEGGSVVRLSDGVLVLPGNMALGATRNERLAYEAGRAQGDDLRRLGFNMNLAPVLDVNINPRNPVIGVRSFGDEPGLVSSFGAEFVRGQQDANIATVAKHFPGHGSSDSDSHKQLPVLTETEDELVSALRPFEAAMKVGLDGMMTAHVAAPKVTGDELPATLSERILGDILRRRMKFNGLVLTDEHEMEAIADRYGVGRAAVMAIKAGADMVLVPWRVERKAEAHAALLEAVKNGEISRVRLEDSLRRFLLLKVNSWMFEPLRALSVRL